MDQSEILTIVIMFVLYLILIIFILSIVNMNNVYSVMLCYITIILLIIILLIFIYNRTNSVQFPTIENKKMNAEEIINVALIHNILINKGIKLEHLENSKKEFINLCIKYKFSFDDDKITDIYNNINNLNIKEPIISD